MSSILAFSESILQNHVGFSLYDLESRSYLFEQNNDRYFLPTSNTKIFTFYAGLILLQDQTPGIQYVEKGDSLIFWGTGDPSFLNPNFSKDQPVFDFLKKSQKSLYLVTNNFKGIRYCVIVYQLWREDKFSPDPYMYPPNVFTI